MFIMYIMVLGIAAYGGEFLKINIVGIPFVYITMGALCFSYLRYFIIKRGKLYLDKKTKAIVIFEVYGLLLVICSLLGINKLFISNDLYINILYIPRQAYYLVVLPAIILMREKEYIYPLKKIIDNYGELLFWFIYIIKIITSRSFCISVPTVLILSGLTLYNGGTKRTLINYIKFLIIVLTPVSIGGELTNIIIRLIYVCIFLFRKHKKYVVKILSTVLICMILAIFILPVFYSFFESILDANSFWRLKYWNDELVQVWESNLFGVGYGTSYATESFVGKIGSVVGGPFGATAEYTMMDKLFVVGPHNSYIALLFRLGLIGIIMFLFFIFSISNGIKRYYKDISSVSVFLFFSSVVLIGVNVGLESPYYLLLFVFSVGIVVYDITICEKFKTE